MTMTSRSLCRLSNFAFASALIGALGGCGGGGDGVERETALAVEKACAAKNVQTDTAYDTANPLGDAIADASAGHTIQISGVCYGNFVVNKDLTLQGKGGKATLDGGNSGTVLTVGTVGGELIRVTVDKLIITHGNAAGGGGGIYITYAPPAELTLINSTVSGNTASGPGGGIRSWGHLDLVNSNVSDNTSSDSGGGIWSNWRMSLTNSTVSGNTAGGSGGGIFSERQAGELSLTNSTVSGNTASGGGGGISSASSLHVTNSRVSSNTASGGGGISIVIDRAYLTGSTVRGNTASGSGGGVSISQWGELDLTNSTVTRNTAGDTGGGIYNNGTLNLTNSTVARNDPDDIAP